MALTEGRQTKHMLCGKQSAPQKGSTTIYQGGLVMIAAATGYAEKGATATGMFGVGIARSNSGTDRWTNSGSDGDSKVEYDEGVFGFDNSASSDAITDVDVGKPCYIVDDATVARTSNAGARSPAGEVHKVEGGQVYVKMSAEIGRRLAGVFVSAEQTGTGSSQNVAHGLGRIPRFVFVAPTDLTPATVGSYSVVEGTHTDTNVVVTVTSGKKFKVLAFL